jgi:hypothetical protein
MAAPTYSYTLTNGTTADADQVQQNFNDILNGVSDGTKDLSVSAFTAAGAATLNGAVTLGNGTADDITFTGSLASSIPIKTDSTFNIGSATLGLNLVYLTQNSNSVALSADASASADYTFSYPPAAGASGTHLITTGSGANVYRMPNQTVAKVADYTVTDTDGVSTVLMTTSTTDRIVTLPTASANTHRRITIIKVDSASGKVTIDGEGSETIDGAVTRKIPGYAAGQYMPITVQCDGTEWFIVDQKSETPWTDYTPPASQGFGTIASVNLQYRRDGDTCSIRGWFTTGTVAASECQMGLPTGATVGGVTGDTALCGVYRRDTSSTQQQNVICTAADTYVNFAINDGANSALSPQNGSTIFASSPEGIV